MSTNLVNKDTGELVTLANGTRIWIGTKTAHDLAVQQGTMPNNCMVCITDESNSVLPDWSNAQSITVSTTEWEAPSDGWIVGFYLYQSGLNCRLTINDVVVSISSGASSWYSAGIVQVMLSRGDKVKLTSSATSQTINFVPFKTL